MRKIVLCVLTGLPLLLYTAIAWAQTTLPPPDSPLPTPTPELLAPPGPMGDWWNLAIKLVSRFSLWPAVGLILVLAILAFFWKVGGEVVGEGAGNVWEWMLSLWGRDWRRPTFGYPYRPDDGREDTVPGDEMLRVVRGGSWGWDRVGARCAVRSGSYPNFSNVDFGFRCVSPVSLF